MNMEADENAPCRALSMDGERNDSRIWYCSCMDGFSYHRVREPLAHGGWAYTCRNRPQCNGRARSDQDGRRMEVVTRHVCPPDRNRIAVQRANDTIIQAAMACPRRLVAEVISGQLQR